MNNIILQNYNNLLKKVLFDIFSTNLKHQINKFNINGDVMNYISLLSNIDESLCNIAKNTLISIIESLDKAYLISNERMSKYHIKSYHQRTIMTVFGEVTFQRTFYKSRINNKSFCYIDRLLGLKKYDYFDPYLKALIIEYSANNSIPKVAKYINNLIGNRIKIDDGFKFLSRQTIRNIILNSKLSITKTEGKKDIENLYVIADEKWIHTQNNNNKDVMNKGIVVFEGIKNNKLINKMAFGSRDNSFLKNTLDYIYESYNTDNIKNIFLMGDGASWIKNLRAELKFNKDTNIIYALDKFHFKQALHHLCQNNILEDILTHYVLKNMKQDLNEVCECQIKTSPHRSKTIIEKQKYINNNWLYINNLYRYNLSCPMESQISHIFADLFTSRPKAYSIKMIDKLTEIRLLFKNDFNIKKLYLNNFNSEKILTINNEFLNYEIYKKRYYNNDVIKSISKATTDILYVNRNI